MERIKSGIFIMPFHDPAKPLTQCYDEDMELAILADQLGIDEFWVGEHHTMGYENITMPEIFISAAMRETTQIRMGPAPVCLQQHHPAVTASRLAFLDHLCKGRLNLCFGAGTVSTDMELLGIDPKEGAAMAAEAMDMVLELWSLEPPFEINGKYWNISLKENIDMEIGLGITHKPYQKPFPPISMPVSSMNSNTAKIAGRRGFSPFTHCVITGNVVANIWDTYEEAALAVGNTPDRQDFKVTRAIFLADTTLEAERIVRNNSLAAGFEYIGSLLDRAGAGREMFKRDPQISDSDINLSYWMDEQIIAGDVDTVLDRLLELKEEIGEFGTLVMMSYDWDDKDTWVRSTELFATELMPALNKASGRPVT